VPIEIDPDRRCFLGLSISPGAVRAVRVSPIGRALGEEQVEIVGRRKSIIDAARALLSGMLDATVHGIGVSFTGLADPVERKLLFSSSLPTNRGVSLQPIYDAAKDVPIVLDNDMHALSMRWLLTHEYAAGDLLLVGLDDGRLGASLLLDGQPHRGSVSAANELGHTRLAVETDRCFCGQVGCLERIVSSAQLARFGAKSGRTLDQLLADSGRESAPLNRLLSHLVTGLSNAVNFMRPRTVVLAGPLAQYPALQAFIRDELPSRLLPGFRERTEVQFWERSTIQSAENAAWLALAELFGHAPPHRILAP
jgi:predicted NBD/HSP70 family sugar kinase